MSWGLPDSVEIDGVQYGIRTDYRCILDILSDLSNPDTDGQERALIVLIGLYPGFEEMPPEHYERAVQEGMRFINCGEEESQQKAPRLVGWEQDYNLIIAPINRVLGREVRAVEYMHWWTWLAAYREIGDCLFAQIVRIRERKERGKPLDKQDQEFYARNRHLVDFKRKYTEAEDEEAKKWGF